MSLLQLFTSLSPLALHIGNPSVQVFVLSSQALTLIYTRIYSATILSVLTQVSFTCVTRVCVWPRCIEYRNERKVVWFFRSVPRFAWIIMNSETHIRLVWRGIMGDKALLVEADVQYTYQQSASRHYVAVMAVANFCEKTLYRTIQEWVSQSSQSSHRPCKCTSLHSIIEMFILIAEGICKRKVWPSAVVVCFAVPLTCDSPKWGCLKDLLGRQFLSFQSLSVHAWASAFSGNDVPCLMPSSSNSKLCNSGELIEFGMTSVLPCRNCQIKILQEPVMRAKSPLCFKKDILSTPKAIEFVSAKELG